MSDYSPVKDDLWREGRQRQRDFENAGVESIETDAYNPFRKENNLLPPESIKRTNNTAGVDSFGDINDINDINIKRTNKIDKIDKIDNIDESTSCHLSFPSNLSNLSMTKNTKMTEMTSDSTPTGATSGKKVENTDDINDKNDNTQRVLDGISEIPLTNLFDKILGFLVSNSPSTYKDLAESLDLEYNSIVQTMLRKEDYFIEIEKDANVKCFELSPIAIGYLEEKIERYNSIKNFKVKSLNEEEKRLRNTEELKFESQKVIEELKPKINGHIAHIDVGQLIKLNPSFSEKLFDEPDRVIEIMKESALSEFGVKNINFFNLPKFLIGTIENLRSNHLGKFLVIEGRCVSLSSVRPTIQVTNYQCSNCGNLFKITQQNQKLQSPKRCSCGSRNRFNLLSKEMADCSNVMLEDLQEKTDNPNVQRVKCRIKEELTKDNNISIFTPGNEIRATGILREVPSYIRGEESVERGIRFDIITAEMFEPEIDIEKLTDEEKEEIFILANKIDEEGLSVINPSFAPDIYGYEDIKNALIFQLCNKRNNPKKDDVRNKPNILLMGDPGIAKSVLGKFSVAITPGARVAVGGGSSAVGITASVVKEEDSLGGYRVEPGALILAKELLLIDELNNLSDEDKPKLQEGMSEQQVSINKANLHVNLKVTAGILATANPKSGIFNESGSYLSQFNIPIPIINRFDEIFVMLDKVDDKNDKEIANKMIERERKMISPDYNKTFLRKFFVFIRNQENPEIDDGISEKLKNLYVFQRRENTKNLIINPRFMEAITRLIKASAKIRLSKKVEEKDIERALKILNASHYNTKEYKIFKELMEKKDEKENTT